MEIRIVEVEQYGKICDLAESVELDERIDFECRFLGAFNSNDELVGVSGFKFGKNYPRHEHIIVAKKYQKTKLTVLLMNATEEYLRDSFNEYYVALIADDNKRMIDYAKKFGFKEYSKQGNRTWYIKKL